MIDWSNALIGPTSLELIRMDELGLLEGELLDGYGTVNHLWDLPGEVEAIYRLDTVMLLAYVYNEILDQPTQGHEYLRRVNDIYSNSLARIEHAGAFE